MTRVGKFAISVLLAVAGTGCRHAPTPVIPPQSTAPPVQPGSITHVPTLPPVPVPETPKVGPPGSDKPVQAAAPPPPPKHTRRRRHPAATAEGATPSSTTTAAASPAASPAAAPPPSAATQAAPAEPSLGQLSAGNGADTRQRAAATEEIKAQESRLGGIKHPLNDDGEAIAVQVRAFLAKARQAAQDNDLDGARTLTLKAKVLLDELTGS